jgi:hypothetical protein
MKATKKFPAQDLIVTSISKVGLTTTMTTTCVESAMPGLVQSMKMPFTPSTATTTSALKP